MIKLNEPFESGSISPPGDTILDVLDELGWTQALLAKRLGYGEEYVGQLINGKAPLTENAAVRLECVLGSTVVFWLRRETLYRQALEQKRNTERCID